MIDWIQRTVRRVHEVPDGWEWSKARVLDAPDGYVRIEGGVPQGVYRSGLRKGHRKWPKQLQRFWLTWKQVEEEKLRYEADEGLCARCEGTGRMGVGWNKERGRLTETCERCGGTGQAPVG